MAKTRADDQQREKVVLIQKYNPEWQRMFHEIRDALMTTLEGLDVAIEHVGSTAIPGLSAKSIIDIDIIFGDDCFPNLVKRLEEIGYHHNGDQGIRGREAFKRESVQTLVTQNLIR